MDELRRVLSRIHLDLLVADKLASGNQELSKLVGGHIIESIVEIQIAEQKLKGGKDVI